MYRIYHAKTLGTSPLTFLCAVGGVNGHRMGGEGKELEACFDFTVVAAIAGVFLFLYMDGIAFPHAHWPHSYTQPSRQFLYRVKALGMMMMMMIR